MGLNYKPKGVYMFSSLKRFIAAILVVAMVVTSSGITTFAASISHVASENLEKGTEEKKTLSYKYYKEFKSESYLLKDDGDPDDTKLNEENKVAGGSSDLIENITPQSKTENKVYASASVTSTKSDADENKRDKTNYEEEKENDENKTEGTTTDENGNEVGDDYESTFEEDGEKNKADVETSTASEVENEDEDKVENENETFATQSEVEDAEEGISTLSETELADVETSTLSEVENEVKITTPSEYFIATKAQLQIATQSLFGKTGGNLRRYCQYFDSETGALVATTYIGDEHYDNLADVDHWNKTINNRLDDHIPYGYERDGKEAKFGWGVFEPGKYGKIVKKVSGVQTKSKSVCGANYYGDVTDCETVKDDKDAYAEKSKDIDVDWHNYNIGFMWVGNGGGRDVYNWQGKYGDDYAAATYGGEYLWVYSGNCGGHGKSIVKSTIDNDWRSWKLAKLGGGDLARVTTNLDAWYATTGAWAVVKGVTANASNCYEIYQCKVRKKTCYVTYHIVDENRNHASVYIGETTKMSSKYTVTAYSTYKVSYKFGDRINNCNPNNVSWKKVLTKQGTSEYGFDSYEYDNGLSATFPNTTGKNANYWLTSAWGANKWDFNTTITGNMDLYCVWDWKDIGISYNYNGGSLISGTAKSSRKYNASLSASELPQASQVYRKGYTLDYWTYNNNKVTTLAGNNDTVYNLVAVWKKNKVTLKPNWATNTTKTTVTKIVFKQNNSGYTDASKEFLLGTSTDGNMCAYRDGNVITICADSTNKKVYANTSLKELFKGFTNLQEVVFDSKFDTSSATSMESMFEDCTSLTKVDTSSLNTANVTTMKNMFRNCPLVTELNLKSFNFGKVTNIEGMFNGDSALTKIEVADNVVMSNSAKACTDVFTGCTSLRGNGKYGYSNQMTGGVYARVGAGPIAPGYFTGNIVKAKYYINNDWYNSTVARADIKKIEIKKGDDIITYDSSFLMDATQGTWGYLYHNDFVTSFDSSLDYLYLESDASETFANFASVSEIVGFSHVVTTEATNMSGLFKGDENLTNLDLSTFDTKNVTNMS